MYVCMYIHLHIYIHTYMYMYIYIYIRIAVEGCDVGPFLDVPQPDCARRFLILTAREKILSRR